MTAARVALVGDLRSDWERHADAAAQLESKGDEQQWEAAREYAEAAQGVTQKEIARRVGKSEAHISFMIYLGKSPQLRVEGLSFAECYAGAKRPQREQAEVVDLAPPPEGQYRTVLADPPWQYDNKGTRGAVGDVAPGKKFHYETMPLEEIAALAVPAADDAHLYLWTTNAFLRPAFDVMEAWGFDYKTCLTWCKPQIGMGNYFRNNTEHVLFGVRGRLPTNVNDVGTWFEAKRGRHSAKPETFLDLLEAASPGPYFEMFARATGQLWKREGWTYWGNEA